MTPSITLNVPPQRLIDLMNPVVRAVVRSPLHAVLDKAVLVLHITGRTTGRRYDIPVGYLDLDGRLIVITRHAWRANLRGGADLEVTYHGLRRTMRADLMEEPAGVATALHTVIERIGWRSARLRLGLTMDAGRAPTLADLEAAAREYDLATLSLTPLPDTPDG